MRKLYNLLFAGVILFALTFSGISPNANFSSGVLGSFLFLNPTSPTPTNITGVNAVSAYTFSQSTTTYTPAYGGTLLCNTSCDDQSYPVTLPFTFTYNGTAYTSIAVSNNGYLQMGTTSVSGYTPICTGTSFNIVAPFAYDLMGNVAAGDSLRYLTTGISPNRVFTVEWSKWGLYNSGSPYNELDFQVKFFETTNIIQFVYKPETPTITMSSMTCGLSGGSTADYNLRTNTTSWSSTTAGTSNCAYMSFSSTNYPASGLTFTWTPGVASGPPTVVTTTPTASGPSSGISGGNVTDPGGSSVTERGVCWNTAGNPTIADSRTSDGTGTGTYTSYLTGLTGGTLYHVRAYATNSYGTSYGSDLTFTTCSGIAFPYNEDFETVTAPAFPCGWSITGAVSTYSAPSTYNRAPHSGSKYAAFQYGSTQKWAITSGIPLTAGTSYQFSMWYVTDGLSGWTNLSAYYNTTPSATGMVAIPGATVSNPVNTTYVKMTGIFVAPTTGIYYLGIGEVDTGGPWYLSFDDVSLTVAANMSYVSSTTTQTTGNVIPGSTNNPIIGIQVVTSGSISPLSVSQLNLTTTGSTNPTNDIRNGKVFYTGNSNIFATTTQFGTTVLNPNGTFNVTGAQTLQEGTNYFWLTYDIPSTGTMGNVVDATCEQITGSGTMGNVVPVPTAPPGNKAIVGPMAGNYTIGNGMTYPNFYSALADLNSRGLSGAVTFLVKPGIYGTDAGTEIDSTINVATGTITTVNATNTVTFKKKSDEVGDVWVERRGTSATNDYVIGLLGAKYTTFDSINIRQKDTTSGYNMLEWGYYITNPTVLLGSQYNTIKNCQIYLKGSNSSTCGIWQYYTSTPNMPSGSNSYNIYSNNTVWNAYKGIELYGYAAPSPYNLYDVYNQVINNKFLGLGNGGLAAYVYGIYTYYQGEGFKILNNTISSAPNHAYYFYGIYPNYGYDANVDINGNTINANYNANYTCYGIYTYYVGALSSATVQNRVNINNNIFNVSLGASYSSAFYGIYAYYNYADTLNIVGNKFVNDTIPGTGAAYFVEPYYWGNNLNVSNDTINGVYRSSSGSMYPVYAYYSNFANAKQKIYNNYINNMVGVSSYNYGIYSNPATTTTSYIYNNTISNNRATSGGYLYGVYNINAANSYIYGNNIKNLYNSYTSGYVYGIYQSSGVNTYLYNNFISNLKAPSSSGNPAVNGVYIAGGTYNGIYNNSIYIADTSTSTSYGSSGIYLSGSYYIDVRNNNIVNISKPGNLAFANKTSGIRFSSTTGLTYYMATSNDNNIYVGSDSGKAIYFDGTNRDITLQSFKNRVSPRDQSSISEFASYVDAPNGNLHLNTGTPTLLYKGGLPVTTPLSITQDFDGTTRSTTFPTIGAHEITGTYATDVVPPTIIYTTLGVGNTSNRALNGVVITDPTGVDGTTNAPRVYYKKSTQANTFNDNTSSTDGWKYAIASNTSSPFNFTIDYSKLLGGTVTAGDIIQYFVVAQDVATTANVGINAGAFTTLPTSVSLIAGNFPLTGTINQYTIASSGIGASVTVGTGGTYTTLTGTGGLFSAINTGVLTGNVTATIISDIVEPGTNQLQNWSEQTAPATYKIKIVPDGTTIRNIYGWVSNTSGMIRFYGVNNVTVDGSYGGSGKYLKFVNRYVGAGYPTIQFYGGCTYDTLKNCIVEGNNSSTTSGVVLIGAAYTTVPQQANNYLTISGNIISSRSDSLIATATYNGICNYGSGTPLPLNSYNNIVNNEIKNFTYYGIYVASTGSGDGWVIKNNSLYYKQDAYTPAYTGTTMYGLYIMPGVYGSGYTLDSNYIGGSQTLAGGTFMDIKGLLNGLYASVGFNSVSSIRGNVVKNIRSTYITANTATYYMVAGVGGWQNISGNVIGSSDTTQRLQLNGSIRCVYGASSFFAGSVNVIINNNYINNIWTRPDSTIVTPTGNLFRYGIVAGGYVPVDCSNNTILNMLSWQSPGATTYNIFHMGILPNIYSASTIRNNTIYNIANMVTAAPTSTGRILVYGMQPIGMGDGSVFSENKISHIYSNTTGGTGDLVMGIYNAASYYGSTVTLSNNQVSILDNSGVYANVMGVIDVSGSYLGGVCNWYDNSIVVGGVSGVGSPYASYAYYKSTTAGLNLVTNMRNNILYNLRTGGNGNHAATGTLSGTKALKDYPMAFDDENAKPVVYNNFLKAGSTTFTSDYNLLVTSNSNMIGDWYGVFGNMSYWQANSGGDLNSVWDTVASLSASTLFRNYINADLNIDTTQYGAAYVYKKGIGIAGINKDFNGNPRNTSGPVNIGSHEFSLNGNALSTLVLPANNSTGVQTPVILKWTKAVYAANYNLQVSDDSTFTTTTINLNQPDTTYSFNPPNPLTKYYWRVAPKYSNGWKNNYTSVWNFKVIGSPNTVTLNYPANNSANLPLNFTCNWFKSIDQTDKSNTKSINEKSKNENNIDVNKSISNYWFQLSTDSTFSTFVINDSLVGDSLKVLTGLNQITKYYWRVSARNQFGWGASSAIWNFTTVPPAPAVPTLLSPANNSTGIGLLPTLSWNAVTYASSYRLQLSTDSTFATTNLDSAGITGTQISVPSGKLAYNNKYYWRVNATNASGTSSYSVFWNFRTLTDPLALNQSNFGAIIAPSYMTSGTSTRLPVTFRATISGLVPNKTYRYYNLAALYTDLGTTSSGAGILVLINQSTGTFTYSATGSLTTAGQYETFVANSSGSFTGWFAFLNSGNARFTAGNYVMPSVILGDSVGTTLARYALNDSIKVLAFANTAGANNGTGIYGVSLGIPKSMVALYDNETGTGKPLAMTYVENPGITVSSLVTYYVDSVYTRNGRWGTIIPNTLANGVRRVEQRSLTDGSLMSFNSDADGLWPSGANTVNPLGGTTAIRLAPDDAPLLNAPALVAPLNTTVDLGLTPLMVWATSPTAASYRLQISADSTFATTAYDTNGFTGVSINVPSGKLTTNTKYYWRVNATNVSGTGLWSTMWYFTTAPNAPNVPLLVAPANNAVNQPVNITFQWYKAIETLTDNKQQITNNKKDITSTDAISKYWFEYGTDPTMATVILRDSAITDTFKAVVGLTNNTQYYWRIKAKNQTGWSGFSATWNFTTIPPIPVSPTLLTPANGSVDLPLTPTLDWNDVTYATSYRVQVSTSSVFTTTAYDTAGLTPSIIAVPSGKLTTNTQYYWRVSATNAAGTSNYSTVWNFKTIPNAPNAPILSYPANNATGIPVAFTFTWFKAIETLLDNMSISNGKEGNTPDAISKYWFEYGTDPTMATVILRDSAITDSFKAISGLANNTQFYWRVKAKNQIGWGNFSSTWNFTTVSSLPVAPTLLLPANNSTDVSLTPLMDWNDVATALTYRLQISTDSNFATTAWDTSGVGVSQVTIPAGKLTGLTKYYWRVNATNGSGTGVWSTVWNLTTLQNLPVTLKVYLEGFWDGTAQVSDTTMVYLANPATPFAFVDSAKVVLSTTGTASFSFTKAPNGSYYIVVKHRNHLETWSKLPQALTTGVLKSYDFTTAATQAFGDNMKQVGSVWVLIGGDANQDGSVDALDVIIIMAQFGTQGYLAADFNGDNDVSGLDIALFVPDFGMTKVVPTLAEVKPVLKTKDIDIKAPDKTKNKQKEDKSNTVNKKSK